MAGPDFSSLGTPVDEEQPDFAQHGTPVASAPDFSKLGTPVDEDRDENVQQKRPLSSFTLDRPEDQSSPGLIDRAKRSYLGASAISGVENMGGTLAKVADTFNPFTLSEEDAATLYKNDPEKLKQAENSPAMALTRFSRSMQQASEAAMQNLSPEAQKDYGNLQYATLDPSKAAWLSPVKLVGDAVQSLPTTLALAFSAYFTRGVASRVEEKALADGATQEQARAMATRAAAETMAKVSAGTEGAAGFGQNAIQSREQAARTPQSTIEQTPAYQQLIQQGYSPEAARAWLSATAADEGGAISGIADAVTNFFGGPILGKAIGEGGKLLIRAAKGFATEGTEETIQSGLEQFGQNKAQQEYLDKNQDLLDGVAENAAQGFFVGGLTGAAFTGAAGHHAEGAAPQAPLQASDVLGQERAPANTPPAVPAAPTAAGGIESMLADPKTIFEEATRRPEILNTIQQAVADMPAVQQSPAAQAELAGVFKEMQADPKAIFALATQRPDLYNTIAKAAADSGVATTDVQESSQFTPAEQAPEANTGPAQPASSTQAAFEQNDQDQAAQRAREEELARIQANQQNYEQALAQAQRSGSGFTTENAASPTAMELAMRRAGIKPRQFAPAEDKLGEATNRVLGSPAADISDDVLKYVNEKGRGEARAYAEAELKRRDAIRNAGPDEADRPLVHKLFNGDRLKQPERRRAIELGFGYPRRDGTWMLTKRARVFNESGAQPVRSLIPNQPLFRRTNDATDQALVERLNAATGGEFKLAEAARVPVSADARAGAEVAESFGKRVVWIDAQRGTAGLVLPEDPNTIYVNVNSSHPHLVIIGHELLHTLRRTNEAVYQQLLDRIAPLLKNIPEYQQWLADRLKDEGRTLNDEEMTDLAHEELLADFMGDHMMQKRFWVEVFRGQQRSFIDRVRQAVQLALDAIRIRLSIGGKRGFGTEQFIRDTEGVRRAMADAFNAWSRQQTEALAQRAQNGQPPTQTGQVVHAKNSEQRSGPRVAESQARATSEPREAAVARGREAALPKTFKSRERGGTEEKGAIHTNLVAGLSANTSTIEGIRTLQEQAQGGDKSAVETLNGIARDSLEHLFGGLKTAEIHYDSNFGLYGGYIEPSLGVRITFDESERGPVLAALSKFAQNFNQEQVHVRQATHDMPGSFYEDGSYATVVRNIELAQPLSRERVQAIIEESGLPGLTVNDKYFEAYYVGDPRDEDAIWHFEQQFDRAKAALGADGRRSRRTSARLWAYGRGEGTIPYERIAGELRAGSAQEVKTAQRIAERHAGQEVTPASQAREISPEEAVDRAAHEAATSPKNELPEPTQAQKQAGNYTKGHARIAGLDITIENPEGSERTFTNSDGTQGSSTMKSHYGYIRSLRRSKPVSNSLAADAKLFGNAIKADAIRAHGFNSIDIERQRVVERSMLSALKNLEVARAVIELLPVGVVNILPGEKLSAENLSRNPSMLLDRFAAALNDPVRTGVGRFIDAVASHLPVSLASLGAKEQAALGMTVSPVSNGETGATTGAANGDHGTYFSPKSLDNEHLDIFVKPGTLPDYTGPVFVIDQRRTGNGHFDEHKAMLGWTSMAEAKLGYKENYQRGWDGITAITRFENPTAFKTWLDEGDTTKPAAEQAPLYARERAPVWYSALAQKIEAKAPNVASPGLWKTFIAGLKTQGVKQEEIAWSGITDWLDLQQGKVTKERVQDYLKQNGVRVEETTLGGRADGLTVRPSEDFAGEFDVVARNGLVRFTGTTEADARQYIEEERQIGGQATKFSSYQLPGGENYRELLLTLPQKIGTEDARLKAARDLNAKLIDKYGGLSEAFAQWTPAEREEFYRVHADAQKAPPTLAERGFRSSHFDQSNILAHVRFNERTDAEGKKVLFIEEIQSDWAQKGKKEGFDKPLTQPGTFRVPHGVPSAPFVGKTEAWVSLALKRMIRYAAENGFDRIAWTTGEQQADRYDLSKQVEDVRIRRRDNGNYSVMATLKDQAGLHNLGDDVPQDKLADMVGKDLAEKAAKQGDGIVKYSGLDLKVGGEGMHAFYDKIVPNVANDVLKKLGGGRVGEVRIGQDRDSIEHSIKERRIGGFTARVGAAAANFSEWSDANRWITERLQKSQPGFDITPALREKAMTEGVPLFAREERPWGDSGHPGAQFSMRLELERRANGDWSSPDGRFEVVREPDGYYAKVDGEEIGWGRDFSRARTYLTARFNQDVESGKIKNPDEAKSVFNRYTIEQTDAVMNVWKRIAQLPGAFRFAKTEATDPKVIAKDLGVDRVMARMSVYPSQNTESAPSGSIDITFIDGTRGYVHFDNVDGDAYVDASEMNQGGFGAQLYQLALTWAANNKMVLKPDPGGITFINSFRRTEQMASAALRLGTTKYMLPHRDQGLYGWIKNPETKSENDHNLALLLLTSHDNVYSLQADQRMKLIEQLRNLRYNFASQRFEDLDGKPVPNGWWRTLAELEHRNVSAGLGGLQSNSIGGGVTTLQRAVLTQSVLAGTTQRSGRGLASLVQDVPANAILDGDHSLRSLLYARSRDTRSGQVAGAEGREDGGALRRLALATARAGTTALRPVAGALDLANRAAEAALKVPGKLLVAPVTSRLYDRVVGLGQYLAQKYPLAQEIAHGLIADYGLPEPYLDARQDRESRIQSVLAQSKDMLSRVASLDRAQSRIAYLWMQEHPSEAEEQRLLSMLPESSKQSLAQMKQQIDELGQDAVKLGLLSPESFERNRMAYLHRTYKKHELENPGAASRGTQAKRIQADAYRGRGLRDDIAASRVPGATQGDMYTRLELRKPSTTGLGQLERVVYLPAGQPVPSGYAGWRNDGAWEARWFDKDRVGMWRDLSPEERERLGEIDEVRYAFARTMLATTRDIETARFLAHVAATYAKETEDAVAQAGGRVAQAVDQVTTLKAYANDEWVKVPDGYAQGTKIRKYGALAGKFVPGHIWNDIRSTVNLRSDAMAWRLYDQLLRYWKISKALALDTPIPTPSGWTTMGSLKVGDEVFDERGEVCRVIDATDVQHDHQCYEVAFSDETKIVADEEHLWFTLYRGDGGIRTTRQIAETLKERTRGDSNHSIPVAGALALPPADLLVPPYVLGLWLGDGRSDNACMSVGGEDADEIARHLTTTGVECGPSRRDKRANVIYFHLRTPGVDGRLDGRRRGEAVQAKLRTLGVLGHKHIPAAYLRASETQRRELLMGLMDSDGHITENGLCGFATSLPELRDGMLELVRSLGYKPTAKVYGTSCNGKPGRPSHRIHFKAYADQPVFKLARKVSRLAHAPETRQRSQTRQIVSVTRAPSVPVRCILVSSPSHLFLAGDGMVPTHNTALSPAVHTNNVMSNFVLADMAETGFEDIRRALRTVIDAQRGDEAARALMQRYYASGAEGASQAAIELRHDVIEPLLKELENEQDETLRKVGIIQALSLAVRGNLRQSLASLSASKPAKLAAAPFKTMIDAYHEEDTIFRLGKFMREIERGTEDKVAGRQARQAILDYNINAPWVQALRRGPLPFISFSYRAIPMLIETAAKRPWKMMKYLAVGYGLNALAYALLGKGGDEDKERKLMPDEKSGRALGVFYRMLRMPWNDSQGSPVFLDVRRWIPGGDIVDLNGSQSAVPLPSWLSVGGPLSFFMELAANKDLFTGKEIVKDTDTAVEKITKLLDYSYKFIAPNLPIPNPAGYAADAALDQTGLFQTYSWKSIQDAGRGVTDAFGRERSIAQALASSAGVKLGAQPEDVAKQNLERKRNASLRSISEDMSADQREYRHGGISREEFLRRRQQKIEKERGVQRDFASRAGLDTVQ